MTVKYVELPNSGYLLLKVPDHVLKEIWKEVEELINVNFVGAEPYNANLAGALEHEYVLSKCGNKINSYIELVAPLFWSYQNDDRKNKRHYLKNNDNGSLDLWVNLQKKYEHNPPHTHGGDLSFVIWLKVPYDIEKEKSLPNLAKATSSSAGGFYFIYPCLSEKGGVGYHYISVDKSIEGHMVIFKSDLQHAVFPFYTSDEYRISVSGNVGVS